MTGACATSSFPSRWAPNAPPASLPCPARARRVDRASCIGPPGRTPICQHDEAAISRCCATECFSKAGRFGVPAVIFQTCTIRKPLACCCVAMPTHQTLPETIAPCAAKLANSQRSRRARLSHLFLLVVALCSICVAARAEVRIKDIADVEGIRENQLVGYGLVVGLNGTGDKLDSAVFTKESLVGMLERLGVNTRDQMAKLQTKNVAAVMVTASLPAFARTGSRIDISVSAIGDATNLSGGTLLVTPLLAADGEVYGVGQGAVTTGAIAARGAAASVTRNVPTSGRIANGAIVEREVNFSLGAHDTARHGAAQS